jgi:phosphopantetheinyl transferase
VKDFSPIINLWISQFDALSVSSTFHDLATLSQQERRRYHRFRSESGRRRYLASHSLLRKVLSQATCWKIDPSHWHFAENKYGKPEVSSTNNLPPIHFNLSRTNNVVAIAESTCCAVGVDIEQLTPCNGKGSIDAALSTRERVWLRSQQEAVRWWYSVQIWTIKEAYTKLRGYGLALDFAYLEVSLNPLQVLSTKAGDSQPDKLYLWSQQILIGSESYQLSLATWQPSCLSPSVRLHVLNKTNFHAYPTTLMRSEESSSV